MISQGQRKQLADAQAFRRFRGAAVCPSTSGRDGRGSTWSGSGQIGSMADDEQRLTEEARRSREATEKLREEGIASEPDESDSPSHAGNAKTSSGDTDTP